MTAITELKFHIVGLGRPLNFKAEREACLVAAQQFMPELKLVLGYKAQFDVIIAEGLAREKAKETAPNNSKLKYKD